MSERDLFIQWADEDGLDLHPGRFCEFLLADTAAAYRAWQARADLAAQREAELMAKVERLREALRASISAHIQGAWRHGWNVGRLEEILRGEVEG